MKGVETEEENVSIPFDDQMMEIVLPDVGGLKY
jgi:hypothetical protein